MNHSLKRAVATILCASLLGGAVAMMGCAMADTKKDTANMDESAYSFDLLTDEAPTFNTSKPHTVFDLTKYFAFQGSGNVDYSVTEGSHTTFTATADDPMLMLDTPKFTPAQCKSVAIIYRTDMNKDGELYANRSDGVQMGQPGGTQVWRWIPSDKFTKISVVCTAWADAGEDVTFTGFRFDPLNPLINAGDSIDIRIIAFFDTEDGAENFNYEEYRKLAAWEEENKKEEMETEEPYVGEPVDWPDPSPKEDQATPEDTRAGSLTYTESADGSTVTISYTANGETKSYTVPNNAINRFGGFAATDDLSRSLYSASDVGVIGENGEHYVGLFYFLWHGKHDPTDKIYNLQEILDSTPKEDWGKLSTGKYGNLNEFHWFAEPLYGYYYINDEWVLRKHMELLCNIGIDFLFFDTTNNFTYSDTALKVMKILHELNEQGYDAPGVVFYTNTNANQRIHDIYNQIYVPEYYPDTWFCVDGKPVMIGPADANINDFFTMKINQWPTEHENHVNAWPWMDGKRPQYVYKDAEGKNSAINVSVAQHSGNWRFSDSIYGRGEMGNLGRSYGDSKVNEKLTEKYQQAISENPELYKQGLNFQMQWDVAHKQDVPFVLVTGWNEWIAARQDTSNEYADFVDLASVEFSRDIEMMKGGYFDNYYIQLAYNIQKLKGTAPIIVQDARNPINVTGDFTQWDNVPLTYTDPMKDCLDRDFDAYGNLHYTDTTGRNDIVAAKITHDTKNVYFYAKTAHDVSMFDVNSAWMQLYVDADQNAATGWYGYDFIINYQAKDEFTTTVAKYNGTDGAYSFEVIGEVSYRAKGNQLMIAVPLEMLGVAHCDYINFNFKWMDSENKVTTMEQFYTEGDAAPLGRLNYVFNTCLPGSVPPDEDETDTTATADDNTAEAPTDPADDTVIDSDEVTTGDSDTNGCASAIPSAALALTLGGAALTLAKKKRD